jgi:hypothetical protein
MKTSAYNRHRRRGNGAPSISLFPFLAVLICTMGALVPLLFAITRQARLQAAQAASARIAKRKVEIQTQHETVRWRIEQLKTSRKKTQEQVADARLELGHLEDHARRLREKAAVLQKTVGELDQLGSEDDRQYAQQADTLAKLNAQIETARREVTDVRAQAAVRNKSYAIIPFDGLNQTHRRPIYLECRRDAVVLQPEGIELPETDFEGPLGPGNPLASAIRAVREYLLANHGFDPERDGEPYPLLLVRPDGIAAYYAARAAMKSWATEFGYELIDADWKLAFEPPDPQLARVLQEVLLAARARQQRLIAAAPGAYSKKPKAVYRASPTRGGSIRVGGSEEEDQYAEDSGFSADQPSGRTGPGRGAIGASAGQGGASSASEARQVASLYGNAGTGYGNAGTAVAGGAVAGEFAAGGSVAGGLGTGGVVAGGSAAGGLAAGGFGTGGGAAGGLAAGSSTAGEQGGSPAYPGGPAHATGGLVGGGTPGSGSDAGTPLPGAAGQGTHAAYSGQTAANGGQTTGNSGQQAGSIVPGTWNGGQGLANSGQAAGNYDQPTGAKGSPGPTALPEGYIAGQPPREQPAPELIAESDENQAVVRRAMPLRPGEWQPHEKPPASKVDDIKRDDKNASKHGKSLASKRGKDWALPDAAGGSVAITRPINVECRADQLIIAPEPGQPGGKIVPLGPSTEASTQAFVSAIWERMDAWGIAGRGMYWRPVIHISVAPGAEQRYADLAMLLEGSGLKIERK